MKTNPWLTVIGLSLGLSACDGSSVAPVITEPPPNGGSDGFPGVGGTGGTGFPGIPTNLPPEPIVASRPPPAISGGTLVISPDGTRAVAADPDRDNVYVIDLATRAKQTIQLEDGVEPGRIAFDGAGRAHVALRSAGALLQVDLVNATVLRQTAVCDHPRGVAYQNADDVLLVACAGGDLVSLSAADHAERARTFLDRDLRDVVITKDQRTLVSRFRAAELIEVDALGKELRRITPASFKSTRFHFDPMTGEQSQQIVTLTPRVAWRTALSADGSVMMLHQRSQEDEVVVAPGGYGGGCSSVTETTVTEMGSDASPIAGWSLGGATTVVDIARSPNGQWFAVAAAGSFLHGIGGVQLYSASGIMAPPAPESSCGGPSADGSYSAQVTAVGFDPTGRLLVQSREPAQLEFFKVVEHEETDGAGSSFVWAELLSEGVISLDGESMRDTGHELFHANVGGGIACASCHPEGRDDGHTWTFAGIGARRTQNMGGGLKGTEPFHWDGDMTSFQHLVDDVMTGRMGGFVVEPKYATSLLGWIDHIPTLKLPIAEQNTVALDQAARGQALFESSNCASCHSGSSFTNNASVDVGTGGAFQVPSLRGLGLRGPFMHNGCAKDLAGRFDATCGGGDKHGTTSNLTPAQISDLSAYLTTL